MAACYPASKVKTAAVFMSLVPRRQRKSAIKNMLATNIELRWVRYEYRNK